MSESFSLLTHRSDENPLLKQMVDAAVQGEIRTKWQSKRYRRLVYYFFEKEIETDTQATVQKQFFSQQNVLLDPEVQALVQRSAQTYQHEEYGSTPRYEATRIINDYLLGQGEYSYDASDAHHQCDRNLLSLLEAGSFPAGFDPKKIRSSDVCAVLHRRRQDCYIIKQLVHGAYNYRSLVQVCGEYIAVFGSLPLVLTYHNLPWTSQSFLSLLEEGLQKDLALLLEPHYEVLCYDIPLLTPYGYSAIEDTPYMTAWARFGKFRSRQAWYIKIMMTIILVLCSAGLGTWALLVMPVVRGLLQGANSARERVRSLGLLMKSWYRNYAHQHALYVQTYDVMIDPERSSRDSVAAQQTMSRWYDVLPQSGHDLMRNVQHFSQKCMHHLAYSLSHGIQDDCLRDSAQIKAISDWSEHYACPLWTIPDIQCQEQIMNRFMLLQQTLFSTIEYYKISLVSDDQYESINDIMTEKIQQFRVWVSLHSGRDTIMVTVSSGILGWLGAYLRNWSSWGQHVLAASTTNTLTTSAATAHIDDALLSHLSKALSPHDMERLLSTLQHDQGSSTLWQTLTQLFGHKTGNTVNTMMMDTWRRALDDQGRSELFTKAFERGLATGSQDTRWGSLLDFLDHIYNYDNFATQKALIHQDWLADTLHGLHDGTMTIQQFEQLSQAQREIISQAAFTVLHKEDVADMLLDISPVKSVLLFNAEEHFKIVHTMTENIIPSSVTMIDSGLVTHTGTGEMMLQGLSGDDVLSGSNLNSGSTILESGMNESISSSFSLFNSHMSQFTFPTVRLQKKLPDSLLE